jgi:hypothetical protein
MNRKHSQPFESEHEPRVTSSTYVPNANLHRDTFNSQSVLGNAAVAEAATNTGAAGASGFHARSAMQAGFGASDLQQKVGNSVIQRSLHAASIQPKLAVGQPDDLYEQEADHVAQMVMRMPSPSAPTEASAPVLERKCAASETAHEQCSKSAEGQGRVQRKPLFSRITSFIQRHASASEGSGESELRQPVESQIKKTRGGGEPLSASARSFFEPRFGMDFNEVRVHTGNDANEMNRAVGARAFTHGSDIYFGAGNSPADLELTAHELTHVVQQTGEGAATLDADPALQRAVATNGGSFDATTYTPQSAATGAVGDRVGAHIVLEFTANDLVESTKIGLIQSVKAMKSSTPGGARGTVATGVGDPEEGQLIMGPGQADPGREIDRAVHPGGRPLPNTSPVYGVQNTPASTVTALGQGAPAVSTSRWGAHKKDPVTHAFLPAVSAIIDDSPGRSIEFVGQTYEHTFESAALAIEGPIPVNTYLGSVSWGWHSDAAGAVTVDPLALVQAGAPSTAFMGAAQQWNAATFHDPSQPNPALGPIMGPALAPAMALFGMVDPGLPFAPVGVPVTTMDSGTVAAADMSTPALVARIALVNWQIASLAPGTDRTNKEFEKRALEAQLPNRNIKVSVHVISTEDWGSDEVYVKLIGPGGTLKKSGTHDLNNGDSHDFLFSVADFLPLGGPIQVQVFDEDWPDKDDQIVDMSFASPWTPARNSSSMDEANYEVVVSFEH